MSEGEKLGTCERRTVGHFAAHLWSEDCYYWREQPAQGERDKYLEKIEIIDKLITEFYLHPDWSPREIIGQIKAQLQSLQE